MREEAYTKISKVNIPKGMWIKCKSCLEIIYNEDLVKNYKVCPICGYHLRLIARERVEQIIDKNTFVELNEEIETVNVLDFDGYEEKLEQSQRMTTSSEAVLTGTGEIDGIAVAIGIMDSYFMMGSMGSAVGERITRLIEYATSNRLPLILFTASGGARMQEGIISLMQMAKISAAIGMHDKEGLLYLVVLTDPTTGGVTASFAMQGDFIISEPNALVGFAGKRVIENTIKQKLPDSFQTAEFIMEKGFIDNIVERKKLKQYIAQVLDIHVRGIDVGR